MCYLLIHSIQQKDSFKKENTRAGLDFGRGVLTLQNFAYKK